MRDEVDVSSALTEIQLGKLSLAKVSDMYGGVMALCSVISPVLKAAFTTENEPNVHDVSAKTLREMLNKHDDLIYQSWELFRMISDSMATIDEATASASGSFEIIGDILTGKMDEETNYE